MTEHNEKKDETAQKQRKREEILADIECLVQSKGYFYSLLTITAKDLFLPIDEYISVDWRSRLSFQEINFLFGLLIKRSLDVDTYPTPDELSNHVDRTYRYLEELHISHTMDGFIPLMEDAFDKQQRGQDVDPIDMFSRPEMIVEAVFYDESGAYDHQYAETTPKRYKNDKMWIKSNLGFSIENAIKFASKIKKLTESKRHKIKKEIATNFFDSLKEIFTVGVDELDSVTNEAKAFLDLFSVKAGQVNTGLTDISGTNILNVKPLIRLDNDQYLLPVSFYLFRSIDESPFTVMWLDKSYKSTAEQNRGNFTEDECFTQLKKVFGEKNVYKHVQVQTKKGEGRKKQPIKTDIDVLVTFQNKVIVVQSKSKKMTLLSRQGELESFREDFKQAIQESYEQALKCRTHIFSKDAVLVDENSNEICIYESINEVYLLLVTTDYYPALSIQTKELIKKDNKGASPIALNLYDLQLLVEYLPDPFDFIFYIHQRATLADKTLAAGEMSYLGYHLENKLYIDPNQENQFLAIDSSCGQYIDDDVVRKHYGTEKDKKLSKLEQKWLDPDYAELLRIIKLSTTKDLLDAVFLLLQLSPDSILSLVTYIKKIKQKAVETGKGQSFTLELYSGNGISYLVETNPKVDLSERIIAFGMARKYKAKSNEWMVLGSYSQSKKIIDSVAYNREKWEENEHLELLGEVLLNKNAKRIISRVGRNEPCPCGSGKKYKKCHFFEDSNHI